MQTLMRRYLMVLVGCACLVPQGAIAGTGRTPQWFTKLVRGGTQDSIAAKNAYPDPSWLPAQQYPDPSWQPREKKSYPNPSWQPTAAPAAAKDIDDVDAPIEGDRYPDPSWQPRGKNSYPNPSWEPRSKNAYPDPSWQPRDTAYPDPSWKPGSSDVIDVLAQDMREQSRGRLLEVLRGSNLFLNMLRFDRSHGIDERLAVFTALQRLGSDAAAFDDQQRVLAYLRATLPSDPRVVRKIGRIIQQELTAKQLLWPHVDADTLASLPIEPAALLERVLRQGSLPEGEVCEAQGNIAEQVSRCMQRYGATLTVQDALVLSLVLSTNGRAPVCADVRAQSRCTGTCAAECALDDAANDFMVALPAGRLLVPPSE